MTGYVPFTTLVESQVNVYGAVVTVPTTLPLTSKATCAILTADTPGALAASAVSFTSPLTGAPAAGAVIATVGGETEAGAQAAPDTVGLQVESGARASIMPTCTPLAPINSTELSPAFKETWIRLLVLPSL
jgi:hypothetical protein